MSRRCDELRSLLSKSSDAIARAFDQSGNVETDAAAAKYARVQLFKAASYALDCVKLLSGCGGELPDDMPPPPATEETHKKRRRNYAPAVEVRSEDAPPAVSDISPANE